LQYVLVDDAWDVFFARGDDAAAQHMGRRFEELLMQMVSLVANMRLVVVSREDFPCEGEEIMCAARTRARLGLGAVTWTVTLCASPIVQG
jgi:hypothetical protein